MDTYLTTVSNERKGYRQSVRYTGVRYGRRSHTRSIARVSAQPCIGQSVGGRRSRHAERLDERAIIRVPHSPLVVTRDTASLLCGFRTVATGSFGAGWMSAGAGRPSVAELA